jgi:pyridoxamine-phosphate oxidase
MRVSYTRGRLSEDDVSGNAIDQFADWFQAAKESSAIEVPNAMTLATVAPDGAPSARVVLLKGFSPDGFVFYTDYNSRKGRELEGNPSATVVFFWEPLQRSVRVEGRVSRVSSSESDEYFQSRPRASQLSALASDQSSVLPEGRASLEAREAEVKTEYSDLSREVPRPENWGGYRLVPDSLEFWQGRESRLHDRLRYVRDDNAASSWRIERLSP